jgi:hypothetical protein
MKMLSLWACIEPTERPGETAGNSSQAWMQAWKQSRSTRDDSATHATTCEKAALRHPAT